MRKIICVYFGIICVKYYQFTLGDVVYIRKSYKVFVTSSNRFI